MAEEPRKEESSEKQYPVRRVCSWCKKEMGLADFTNCEPGMITHTLCEDCKEKYFGKGEER